MVAFHLVDDALIPELFDSYKKDYSTLLPSPGESGPDYSLSSMETVTLQPFQRRLIHTGITVEIPEGGFGIICSHPVLAHKNGVIVLNNADVIRASHFPREIAVSVLNLNVGAYTILQGATIAKLLLVKSPLDEARDVRESSQKLRP